MAPEDKIKLFEPSAEFKAKAHVNNIETYKKMYERSINDPEGFWSEIVARR